MAAESKKAVETKKAVEIIEVIQRVDFVSSEEQRMWLPRLREYGHWGAMARRTLLGHPNAKLEKHKHVVEAMQAEFDRYTSYAIRGPDGRFVSTSTNTYTPAPAIRVANRELVYHVVRDSDRRVTTLKIDHAE